MDVDKLNVQSTLSVHQRQNLRLLRLCTLYGMQKETKNNVYTIHKQLWNMLANSLAVIGLSWGLDQKKNGAEPILTNQMDHGIERKKK